MNNQELIVVKQLPIIEEQLKTLSVEIDEKVQNAMSLVCTEETVKTVKQVRADMNKDFKEMENKRKNVKEQVLAPYMQFEEVYNQYVSDKFKKADTELKNKIDSVEKELKDKKEQEIKDYFEEYKAGKNIDFITYEQAKINVTLTSSKKSLKEQVESFIDKISDDLQLIYTQEHKAEILVEYKKSLNVSNAITTVLNRIEAVKQELKQQEEIVNKRLKDEANQIQNNLNNFKNPVVENEESQTVKTYTIPFNATGTAPQLKRLKDFMDREGIKYESITSTK